MRAEHLLGWLLLSTASLCGQTFEQKGFLETDFFGFPQTAPNDSGRFVGEILLRWDASYQPAPWFTLSGGLEAQTDTHNQTERSFRFDTLDRSLLRPAFSLRSLKVTLHRGHFTADLGKQFIHWGQADIVNPTDRFAPRDYLNVVDNEVSRRVRSPSECGISWHFGRSDLDADLHPEPHASYRSTLGASST